MKLQLVVVGLLFGTVLSSDWSYDINTVGEPYGPEKWSAISAICDATSQSPIDIDTNNVMYDQTLLDNPFVFDNYNSRDGIYFNLNNNGHSVELLFSGKESLLTGGNLPGEFRLFQIHFHWGSTSSQGSEHALDGVFYPMEMHMVHTNTQYTVAESLSSPNGLAVLGFFFEISQNDNPAFDPIIQNLQNIKFKGQNVDIATIPFMDLMAQNLENFYRYSGSLTTPNCYETVTWTVFEEKIPISERQMAEFRNILEGEVGDPEHSTNNNFRPLQNLNGRTVYTSNFLQGQFITMAGSSHLQASLVSLLLASLLLLVLH